MKNKPIRLVLLLVCAVATLQAFALLPASAQTTRPEDSRKQTILNAPAIAELASFSARVVNGKNVRVKWETGTEYTLLGFNLYRKAKNATSWEKLNKSLIPPKGAGTLQGALYAFTDKQVPTGKKYQYRLEMLGTYGNTAYSDIVTVKLQ